MSESIPDRWWKNTPCYFTTKNTRNKNGNSRYEINDYLFSRDAPVNKYDHLGPVSVRSKERYVCYLDYADYRKVIQIKKDLKENPEKPFIIESLAGDAAYLHVRNVDGALEESYILAYLKPRKKQRPFDFFIKNKNEIFEMHVGHAINDDLVTFDESSDESSDE